MMPPVANNMAASGHLRADFTVTMMVMHLETYSVNLVAFTAEPNVEYVVGTNFADNWNYSSAMR